MQKRMRWLSLLLMYIIGTPIVYAVEHRAWTFLVYIAGDNDLKGYIPLDIKEMEKGSKGIDAHILVFVNQKKDGKKITQKIVVDNGTSTVIKTKDGLDSGDPKTLFKALKWAHKKFSSDYFACILWDHGDGPLNRSRRLLHRGVCFDDTTGNYFTDRDYSWAVEQACKELRDNKKIDIIGFDACLMANIEVAFALRKCANFMVASQETEPGPGYNYNYVLSALQISSNPEMFVGNMITAFKKEYESNGEIYTLSAINLNALEPLTDAINTLSMMLGAALKNQNDNKVTKAVKAAVRNTTNFDEETYRDIVELMNNLSARIGQMGLSNDDKNALRQALSDVVAKQKALVVRNTHSDGFTSAEGLSIYFPDKSIDSSYYDLLWSEKTAWLSFLKAYSKSL